MDLTFRDVDAETWGDMRALFEGRGGPKYCWCLVWRPKPKGVSKFSNDERRAVLYGFVARGVPIGFLAYDDGEPVAWCSLGPRSEHARLGGPGETDDASVWSLTCFFIRRSHRGQGVSRLLIGEAVSRARKAGAQVLEAYPVDADSPSYRFMGFVPVFAGEGFTPVARAGTRRHVMRCDLYQRDQAQRSDLT